MKFILSAAAGALGVFVTFAFIPEITTLDLKDGDMRWEAIKRGDHEHIFSLDSICHLGLWLTACRSCCTN